MTVQSLEKFVHWKTLFFKIDSFSVHRTSEKSQKRHDQLLEEIEPAEVQKKVNFDELVDRVKLVEDMKTGASKEEIRGMVKECITQVVKEELKGVSLPPLCMQPNTWEDQVAADYDTCCEVAQKEATKEQVRDWVLKCGYHGEYFSFLNLV